MVNQISRESNTLSKFQVCDAQQSSRKVGFVRVTCLTPSLSSSHSNPGSATSPDLAQQLREINSQISEVLSLLPQVTSVTLRLRHEVLNESNSVPTSTTSKPSLEVTKQMYATYTHAVCSKLSAALSLLTELRLEGLFLDAVLDVFGTSCPLLTHLRVEALTVPIIAFSNLTAKLPGLRCLTLHDPQLPDDYRARSEGYGLTALEKALAGTVREVLSRLTSSHVEGQVKPLMLVLDFDKRLLLRVHSKYWNNAPQNLTELVSRCEAASLQENPGMMATVRSLTMQSLLGRFDLFSILERAPCMARLCITGRLEIGCNTQSIFCSIHILRPRIERGLSLHIRCISFTGTHRDIGDQLAAMPKLPRTYDVKIIYDDSCRLFSDCHEFLKSLSRVFPYLTTLRLVSRSRQQEVGLWLLGPLEKCKQLRILHINRKISNDGTGRMSLRIRKRLLGIPRLEIFTCIDSKRIRSLVPTMAECSQFQKIRFEEYAEEVLT